MTGARLDCTVFREAIDFAASFSLWQEGSTT